MSDAEVTSIDASPVPPAPKSSKRGRQKKAVERQQRDAIAVHTNTKGGSPSPNDHDTNMRDIRQRLAFLCQDLRTFSANKDAELRLNTSVHTHFLGPPYLAEAQAELVRCCPLSELRQLASPSGGAPSPSEQMSGTPNSGPAAADGDKSLSVFLDERMASLVAARKSKSESDFVLCTSHDLAPLLQEACGLSRQHFETRAFKDAYKRWTKEVRKDGKKAR